MLSELWNPVFQPQPLWITLYLLTCTEPDMSCSTLWTQKTKNSQDILCPNHTFMQRNLTEDTMTVKESLWLEKTLKI